MMAQISSNGFLDSIHQGVQFSKGEDPVLYLRDPEGMDRQDRRAMLDNLAQLHRKPPRSKAATARSPARSTLA